jgi:hypothetical protein
MNSAINPRTIAAILAISAPLFAGAATIGDEVTHSAAGIAYVSGGVGAESIDRLNLLAADFNLKLVFASKSGAYLSDVRVVIENAKGDTLLDVTSQGPWLLARLPVASYRITATSAGAPLSRLVGVGAARLKRIDFRWPDDR